MDLQGTPIPPGPRSTKVTTDPEAYQQPIDEPSGPVANDSLAAESVRQGGAFSQNRGAEPLGVSGSKSTLNNTDTSAATTLPSAPGGVREDLGRQEKYPDALGGQGDFPGAHLPESGYTGGPSAAKQDLGITGGRNSGQTSASGSNQYSSDNRGVQEGGFSGDYQNASFTSEIGSEQDPGRAAEQKFQRTNFESGPDVGGPRQKGVDNQNPYGNLADQRA
ncbi:hypothetical protein N7468_002444 [Penicillium chermesinum]|uniref:Uncharacterized protein n=1 Tax=Penicillium chermesinum TaxID=63820 RepID=A0A9W9TXJ5_9EURO|nr:uncharacterized protein N7468_002444 [Penicillium chermesinum]KAJ5247461.1 hypothetical protein N7468_002444 [Penicillium chermesinum]KAJ6145699.1 hypothetical protein N7470_009594 [Penicillium chermesinum]